MHVSNPGQFFACCGLLELAHRLWPGCEGWFDRREPIFAICSNERPATLESLMEALSKCKISGLSEEERKEREGLEAEKRRLKKERREFPRDKEDRRKELGTMAREGTLLVGSPFSFALNWWQTGDDDPSTPKTWAGLQELHKVARAAQDALKDIVALEDLFDYSCVLRLPTEYQKRESDRDRGVEPFYFDARRFAHALDIGFSLDVQNAETVAHPAVELLCLIGLQRFRPSATSHQKWGFEYHVWPCPLSAAVAAATVCGVVPADMCYRFLLRFRDDQKRYKAFSFATSTAPQESFLREGCQLVPDAVRAATWTLVGHDGRRENDFVVSDKQALAYATRAAKEFGVGQSKAERKKSRRGKGRKGEKETEG